MEKDAIVQINPLNSRQLKFISMRRFLQALTNDPDLSEINPNILPNVLQTIYITSGCDYISFFSIILGKQAS